jgi:hypothetical protein
MYRFVSFSYLPSVRHPAISRGTVPVSCSRRRASQSLVLVRPAATGLPASLARSQLRFPCYGGASQLPCLGGASQLPLSRRCFLQPTCPSLAQNSLPRSSQHQHKRSSSRPKLGLATTPVRCRIWQPRWVCHLPAKKASTPTAPASCRKVMHAFSLLPMI